MISSNLIDCSKHFKPISATKTSIVQIYAEILPLNLVCEQSRPQDSASGRGHHGPQRHMETGLLSCHNRRGCRCGNDTWRLH